MKKAARNKKGKFIQKLENPVVEVATPEGTEQKKVKKIFTNKPVAFGVLIILLIVLGAGGVYFYTQNNPLQNGQNAQPNSAEVGELMEKVGEKMQLPENDPPTVATVTDVSKLSNEQFFANAQNGDKVLIFASNKQAILYRPSIDKIIAVAPVDPAVFNQQQSQQTASGSSELTSGQDRKIKVAVLNSTKESGLARKGGALLNKDLFEVASTGNAQGEYETTSVANLNKTQVSDAQVSAIVSSLTNIKASVGSLPPNEAAPAGAEVVIILGTDFADTH